MAGLVPAAAAPDRPDPRMTAKQQADSSIELGKIARERELGPVLDNITVPARDVVASGTCLQARP